TINTTFIPSIADIALDPASDTVWGIEWNGSAVARVDLASGATTLFSPLGVAGLGGIAMTGSGRLFVSSHGSRIVELDPSNASVVLRSVTIANVGPDGMAFDGASGHLFSTGCGGICELDIGTDSQPTLQLTTIHSNVDGDGIAADARGHLVVVT